MDEGVREVELDNIIRQVVLTTGKIWFVLQRLIIRIVVLCLIEYTEPETRGFDLERREWCSTVGSV